MTGDRDTLTDEERAQIADCFRNHDNQTNMVDWGIATGQRITAVVESIIAARVRAAQAQAWEESCRDHYGDGHYSGLDSCPRNPYSEAGDEFQNPED